jgi:hypothetical protein
MLVERRRKRSTFTSLSLQYWLYAIAQRKHLFALVLADSAGLLVAASIPGPEAEELAAIAPLLGRNNKSEIILTENSEVPVVIHKLTLGSSPLLLCAIGDAQRGKEGVRLAEEGIHRILDIL